MKIDEIRAIARSRGLFPGRLRKADLVRNIQKAEGNVPCFDTGAVQSCGQKDCLWREDCV